MSEAIEAYQFKPHERPLLPGSPATPDHPLPRRIAYFAIGILLGLAAGFASSLLTANLPQIQGALGLTPVEGGWLTAAYTMTNVCMSMLLIKFRQQFGLQRFTRLTLAGFTIIMGAQIFVHDFWIEVLVRGGAGIVGSGLITLCFFYFMQALPASARLAGLILGFSCSQIALPLARVISPLLLYNGRIQNLFVFEFGLVLLCLAAVALLRLPPSERMEAFEPLDFVTFGLFAPGMALLCAVLALGRIVWWDAAWIGYALAAAIPLIGGALLIEHNRCNPLLNTRWIGSRRILRFAIIAASIRILLSEQTYGSLGLLTVVGMTNDQLVTLNFVVTLASIAGTVAGIAFLNPKDLLLPVVVSLALISLGAWMDSDATNISRPVNFYWSQALIAFAALLFLAPTVMIGLVNALARGPNHLVSFSALFSITQSLGAIAGSAFLGSMQILREKYHSNQLVESIVMSDPQVASRIQSLGGAYGRVIGDPVLRQAEGGALLAQQVTREANILAYNDVFLMISVLAFVVLIYVGIRWTLFRIRGEVPFGDSFVALQRMIERSRG